MWVRFLPLYMCSKIRVISVCYKIEPWAIKWTKRIPTRMYVSAVFYWLYWSYRLRGHAILDGQSLFISNLINGVDLYAIPNMERHQTFPHAILHNVPLQIAVTHEGQWMVLGGDNGFARVYDRWTGQFLHRLDHGTEGGKLIQNVAVRNSSLHQRSHINHHHHYKAHSESDASIIVTGSSSPGRSIIKVWSATVSISLSNLLPLSWLVGCNSIHNRSQSSRHVPSYLPHPKLCLCFRSLCSFLSAQS